MSDNKIQLKTGRKFCANRCILGLSEAEPFTLFDGYDDIVCDEEYSLHFSPEERSEIADRMIALWQRWRDLRPITPPSDSGEAT